MKDRQIVLSYLFIIIIAVFYSKGQKAYSLSEISWQRDSINMDFREVLDYSDSLIREHKYYEAIDVLTEAVETATKAGSDMSDEYADLLLNLADCYHQTGNYPNAEIMFSEARELKRAVWGSENENYAGCLKIISDYYDDIGMLLLKEPMLLELLKVREKTIGVNSIKYAEVLEDLGILYHKLEKYERAEYLFVRLLDIRRSVKGKDNIAYAMALNYHANNYRDQGKSSKTLEVAGLFLKKAEKSYLESVSIFEKLNAKDDFQYASLLNDIAWLYDFEGDIAPDLDSANRKFDMAEAMLLDAVRIVREIYGKEHLEYTLMLKGLADFYEHRRNMDKAEELKVLVIDNLFAEIRKRSTYITKRDKERITSIIEEELENFYSFTLKRHRVKPDIVAKAYNYKLNYKALILGASKELEYNLLTTSDTAISDKYIMLSGLRKNITNIMSKPLKDRESGYWELENSAKLMEQELVTESNRYRELINAVNPGWKDVKNNLTIGEAAIEIINFRHYVGNMIAGTYYCALIVMPSYKNPAIVKLCEEADIKELMTQGKKGGAEFINSLYDNEIKSNNRSVYDLVWEPLSAYLKGVSVIYYVPSGILRKISFSAIKTSDNLFLADKYEMKCLSSTNNVSDVKNEPLIDRESKAVIYGGIEYSRDTTTQNVWKPLKSSRLEADKIKIICRAYKIKASVVKDTNATEMHFKSLSNIPPNIIHVSTRALFYPDPMNQGDAVIKGSGRFSDKFTSNKSMLFRSGLLFALVNDNWTKDNLSDQMDGILTAYEIADLRLHDNAITVLSSLDTKICDPNSCEGIYALITAFKNAGVKYLIYTLWAVPDKEKIEFLTHFYRKMFRSGNVSSAFRDTQLQMRSSSDVYNWASFILVE